MTDVERVEHIAHGSELDIRVSEARALLEGELQKTVGIERRSTVEVAIRLLEELIHSEPLVQPRFVELFSGVLNPHQQGRERRIIVARYHTADNENPWQIITVNQATIDQYRMRPESSSIGGLFMNANRLPTTELFANLAMRATGAIPAQEFKVANNEAGEPYL